MNNNDSYFHRIELLLGHEGMERLYKSNIAIVGIGGVGSYAAEAVCRCGIRNISVIDPDLVETSNINRQIPATSATIGRYKTDVMSDRMREINPSVKINQHTCSYTPTNSSIITEGHFDYVIDAIDSLNDKIHLISTCLDHDIPIISCMGTANRVNPSMLEISDIKDTSVCPVARRVRRGLRQNGVYSGLNVVYSREIPLKKGPELGSIVFVTAVAGMMLASFAVNSILGLDINYSHK